MIQRTRLLRQTLFFALALFVSGMLTLSVYTLWRLHTEALHNGLDVAEMHSRSFEDLLTQSLYVSELTALNTLPQDEPLADLSAIGRSFATALRQAPFLRSMSLLDGGGRIIASSNPGNVGVTVPTRDYLPQPQEPGDILRLGAPWAGRDFSSGQPSTVQIPVAAEAASFIPATRSLSVAGRTVTLLIALNPDYFINHMAQKLEAEEGSVEVLRYDGTLLMDSDPRARPGSVQAYVVRELRLSETESGRIEQHEVDGRPVLSAFRASRLYPFVVVSHMDRGYALRHWKSESQSLIGVVLPALLVISLLAYAFYRRQLEATRLRALAEQRQRIHATVFEASTEAILITDRDGNILSVNPAFTRISGYSADEVLGRNPRMLASSQHDQAFDKWHNLLQDGTWHGELVNQHKDGHLYDVQIAITASRDTAGEIQYLIGTLHDITETRQAQAAMEKTLALLQNVARRVPGVVYQYRLRPDGHACFPFASDGIREIYRVSPEDVREDAGKVAAILHPDDYTGIVNSIAASARDLTLWRHEYRVKFDDGTVRWLSGDARPEREADGSVLWHGFVTDITTRKQAQATFQALFHQSSFLAGVLDQQNRLIDVNRTALQSIGASREEMIGRYFPDTPWWTRPQDHQQLLETLKQAGQGVPASFEAVHVLGTGQHLNVMFNAMPISTENGIHIAVVGVDITERKQAETALKASEARFRNFFDKNSSVMLIMEPDSGVIRNANDAAAAYYGHSRSQLIGMSINDINTLPPERVAEERHKAEHEERAHFLFRHRLASGKVRDVEVYSTPIETEGGIQLFSIVHDITARKLAEARLSESHNLLSTVIEHTPARIFWKDRDSRYLGSNTAFARDAGLSCPEDLIGKDDFQMGWAAQAARYRADDQAVMASGLIRPSYDEPQTTPSGDTIWLRTSKVPLRDQEQRIFGVLGLYEDITERKLEEIKLRQAASVFTTSQEGILITDAEHRILDVNPAFTHITGYDRDEVLGQNARILIASREAVAAYSEIWSVLAKTGSWQGEFWECRKTGELYAEHLSIDTVRDPEGTVIQYVAVFSDITQSKQHEADLDRIAHYDPLTGVPNRRLLDDRLGQALARARRSGKSLAVCFFDLDGFKQVNDQHGHAAGDQLLREISTRLLNTLRGDDTLARIGGDEFALLLGDLETPAEIAQVLERVLGTVNTPVRVGEGAIVRISASVGATLYPADAADADALLRHADHAMYQAKEAGKNRYHLFDPERDREIQSHHSHQKRLTEALLAGELVLHYQPKVDLRDGQILGVEALIRWQHPEQGLLLPETFLPQIEGSALEITLDDWVIEGALQQMQDWHNAGLPLTASVNLSPTHLVQPHFPERLRQMLDHHPDVNHVDLELEVLETSALGQLDQAARTMVRCRELGVRFSLDDFGTGYASLSNFQRLPVDILKMDRSFVLDMLDDPNALGIVESVVQLAQTFRRPLIATGVETLEHAAMLLQIGSPLAQGNAIAPPMPAQALPEWIAHWRSQALWQTLDIHASTLEDRPLRVAAQSHRHWIDRLTAHLDQAAPTSDTLMPDLDSHFCHFGRWYQSSGVVRYGSLPEFHAIGPLHEGIHALGKELMALAQAGNTVEVARRLPELYALRDQLLARMEALILAIDPQKPALERPPQPG
jgi:diguanylate cyclase (GGDEF)-like protein/PAS domain S-box-containing protein